MLSVVISIFEPLGSLHIKKKKKQSSRFWAEPLLVQEVNLSEYLHWHPSKIIGGASPSPQVAGANYFGFANDPRSASFLIDSLCVSFSRLLICLNSVPGISSYIVFLHPPRLVLVSMLLPLWEAR